MPTRRVITYNSGMFFISFTCHNWLPLIDKVNGYDIVYSWLDHLKTKGHFINGYVIMPSHVHLLISFTETGQSINTIVGNGKRFMAYEIIKRLQWMNETSLLDQLSSNVTDKRKVNGKKHEVWELSFDWKACISQHFIDQKLNYIHNNPCVKKWELSKSPVEYPHSSAKFYIAGTHSLYPVTNVAEMQDVNFIKNK